MKNIVRSAAGANLQTSQLNGKPVVVAANSSLNQKFDIQANLTNSPTDAISMKYAVIGVGGVQMVTNPQGLAYPKLAPHTPNHAGLFTHLPFVMRPINNDIPTNLRAKYRLRRLEPHGGQTYAVYYGKVLDNSESIPTLEKRIVDNGVVTSTPFTYSLTDLNPEPAAMNSGSVVVTSGDYIASTAKIPFTLTVDEINEIINAVTILFGEQQLAIISEIGLVHGADHQVNGDFNGVSLPYQEIVGAQISNFISTYLPLNYLNNALSILLDTGSVEPMLTVTQA